jgi:S-DNA-T family DNA segregation ATPase FtsK/SpoIIIE
MLFRVDPDGETVPVDQPDELLAPGANKSQRRPIIADWLKSARAFRAHVAWHVTHWLHVAAFHVLRAPLYALKAAARIPRGLWRGVYEVTLWASDLEGRPVRKEARSHDGSKDWAARYESLSRLHDKRVHERRIILGISAAAVLIAVAVLVRLAPPPLQILAAGSALAALTKLGEIPGRPITSPAVVATRVEKLTSHVVIRALQSIGLAGLNRPDVDIAFPAPITRDGKGWRADVDLPHGVTATEVLERRVKLASGLRRAPASVWPEPDPASHAGRLILYVADQPISETKPRPYPLAKSGQTSLFEPIPLGVDPRGRPVSVGLFENNVLIGGVPGSGKSSGFVTLLLGATLDPLAEVHVAEFKGAPDLQAFEQIARTYASGPSDDVLEHAMGVLTYGVRELERRAKVLSGLPREHAPESKVTPELARRRSLGLHPLVIGLDEVQELFSDPTYGAEAGRLATKVIKRGRALGTILLLATQRPTSTSMPTDVAANVSIRYCLRVMDQPTNDIVLGTSAYKQGVRATTFTSRDKGLGYLVGASDDPTIVRSYFVDRVKAEAICLRARGLREAQGNLVGYAAGEHMPDAAVLDPARLLKDVLACLPATQERVFTVDLCARLAELRPEQYGQLDQTQLALELKGHGVGFTERGSSTRSSTASVLTPPPNMLAPLYTLKPALRLGCRASGSFTHER